MELYTLVCSLFRAGRFLSTLLREPVYYHVQVERLLDLALFVILKLNAELW